MQDFRLLINGEERAGSDDIWADVLDPRPTT